MSDIGHNNPPPFDRLTLRKDELLAGMNKFTTDYPSLTTQELCDKAADFKTQLITLRDEITVAFDEEKRPWLDGSRACDEKWRPMKTLMPTLIAGVTARLTKGLAYLSEERDRLRREAEDKLRLEQEAADKLKQEAAALQAQADAGELVGSGVDVVLKQEQAITAAANVKAASKAVTALKGTAKAGTGTVAGAKRSASLRPFHTAKITKPLAALGFFAEDERILETLQAVANAKVRNIMSNWNEGDPKPAMPPGIELETVMKAV